MDTSRTKGVLLLALLSCLGLSKADCPTGYTLDGTYCYKLFTTPLSWNEAEGACFWDGGHLVSIADQTEQDFVKTLTLADVWIGLQDWTTPDDFAWINGYNSTSFTPWDAGNPGNANSKCVAMKSAASFDWGEEDCTAALPYICMIPETYNGPFVLSVASSADQESGCTLVSCTGAATDLLQCLTGGMAAGANVINYVPDNCCSVKCQELANTQVTSSSPGADIYSIEALTSASVINATSAFNKTIDASANQKSDCRHVNCLDVTDEVECASLALANHINVFNWQLPTCCLKRCDSLNNLNLVAASPGEDVYVVDTTTLAGLNLIGVVAAATFPPEIEITTEEQTTTPIPTTPGPSTTREPVVIEPWYLVPHFVIMVCCGVLGFITALCCCGMKACASAMCPRTAARCSDYCDYDFCKFARVGPCCTWCYHCCCEDKKTKRRRLRREKKKQTAFEGEWWAYYPGVGWAPAPPDMLPDGADAAGPPAAPGEWDPAFNYDTVEQGGGGVEQGAGFDNQGGGLDNQGAGFDNQGGEFGNQGGEFDNQGGEFDNQGYDQYNQGYDQYNQGYDQPVVTTQPV